MRIGLAAMKFTGLILIVIVGCLAPFAGAAMLQDRLLYFPEKAAVAEVVSSELRAWPTPEAFRGLVAEPTQAVRGTAIVFHGNAGHAGHRSYYAAALTRLGLRVILDEYPGYGPRDGEPGEKHLNADAAQTIALAHRMYGTPLVIIGESLGAAVAASVASREGDRIAGLLLVTPWDRLENVASYHYPWLPAKWLLRDRYLSAAHLNSFDRPLLVVTAQSDTIVPARFGEALYHALSGPKRLIVLNDAGHNDWIRYVDDSWWREAIGFLLDSSTGSP